MPGLYRETGRLRLNEDEFRFLREVSPFLADCARRGLLIGEATDPESPEAPGLVVPRDDWSVELLTPGVTRWITEVPGGDSQSKQKLPSSVLAVAGRAVRTTEDPREPGYIAFARVLSVTGRWVVLHGAALVSDGKRRVAVIIEPAHPARISSLLMVAYGLSDREQDATRLVLQGNSTTRIADNLNVTPHTVQQRLKSIFVKTGVRSRRQLAGKVFFSYYEPRLRDNEKRVASGRPVRGGPLDPGTRAHSYGATGVETYANALSLCFAGFHPSAGATSVAISSIASIVSSKDGTPG
jgi:DNA-binding CsgD family transcriptional regulator